MSVQLHMNPARKPAGQGADLSALSPAIAQAAQRFHAGFAAYAPTPLLSLPHLAGDLGLRHFYLKDESRRFGLNAFKVLGGSYALGRYLAGKLGRPLESLRLQDLHASATRATLGDITFATTTDGNHGRGLAWAARELGYKCVVFMPKGSAQVRVENILAEGADCTVTDLNYDDTVRLSARLAREHNWVVVQDTAWEGYEEIPTWIMQGYTTLALEALEALTAQGTPPTHCFLQAGVGCFAGAVAGFLVAALGDKAPKIIIVEPHAADCIYRSALAGDGTPHAVGGDLATIMAGLACGEPCTISWGALRDYCTAYISCPDSIAAAGMRLLAHPLPGDPAVVSGESGAVTTGIVQHLMRRPSAAAHRQALELGPTSTVLAISTEGDTAPEIYHSIVHQNAHPDDNTQ